MNPIMIGTGAGTKQYFSDAELAGYKGYRDNVLQYVRSCNDVLFEKGDVLHLWRDSDTAEFSMKLFCTGAGGI